MTGGFHQDTVLVVEDDADIREAIAHALRRCGYRVLVAGDGRQAIDRLCDEPSLPELILLDWMMPVMSGFEFLTYQASEPTLRAIPVLILSAVDRPLKIAGLPVAAVLEKPVRMRTLVDVIDRLCGAPRRPRELFRSGRYPAIGTTPPVFDDEPAGEADTMPVATATDSRTSKTIVIKPPRGST